MMKMATIFTPLDVFDLARMIEPIAHHNTIRAFKRAAYLDGGAYGEAPRVHFPARFGELFEAQAEVVYWETGANPGQSLE